MDNNDADYWLSKIVSLTDALIEEIETNVDFDLEQAVTNRGRLIDILKSMKFNPTKEQRKRISQVLEKDKLIEKKLQLLREDIQKQIKSNYLNKEKMKKFNLQNLQR